MQLSNTVLRKSPNSKETVNTYAQSLKDLDFFCMVNCQSKTRYRWHHLLLGVHETLLKLLLLTL